MTDLHFPLSDILEELIKLYGNSASGLQKRINDLTGVHFDRRKLTALARGSKTEVMTINQLLSLEAVLNENGMSLTHIKLFEHPMSLMSTLAEKREFIALFSAREDTELKRMVLSDFDVMAWHEMTGAVTREGFTAVKAKDAALCDTAAEADEAVKEIVKDIHRRKNIAVAAVGSFRTNHFFEVLMCEMAGVPRYEPQPMGALPFQFVYPDEGAPALKSAFELRAADIEDMKPSAYKKVLKGGRALVVNRKGVRQVFEASAPSWNMTRDLGIIAAQIQPDGNIWLVVAGLSGAGTLAAAQAAVEFRNTLPQPLEPGQRGAIIWAAVEAKLRTDAPRGTRATRKVHDWRLGQVHFWRPANQGGDGAAPTPGGPTDGGGAHGKPADGGRRPAQREAAGEAGAGAGGGSGPAARKTSGSRAKARTKTGGKKATTRTARAKAARKTGGSKTGRKATGRSRTTSRKTKGRGKSGGAAGAAGA